MKKIILVFLLGFLLFPSYVLAKPPSWTTPPNKPEVTRPVITRVPLPTKKAEIKARLTEKRQQFIRQFFNQMVKRLEAAIARLEKLISRIESRLAKLESQGEDVSKIKTEVADAKTKLAKAKADLEKAKNKLETVLASDDPKAAFGEVRTLIKGVKSQLIEVHRILVHVIGDIKGLRVGQITPTPTI
ncbi:MAG: hypothetical protein ACOZBZ_00235 [Patescibacteria group bacterium]